MILNRKVSNSLSKWKSNPTHKPLIIQGLKGCGKSFVAEQFATSNYDNYVIFDFANNDSLSTLFVAKNHESLSLNSIIELAANHFIDQKFVSGHTCLIFKEIQLSPSAREALKLFNSASGYDVIATSSFNTDNDSSSTTENVFQIKNEEYLDMAPLDFEEFLWAYGCAQEDIDSLKEAINEWKDIPSFTNSLMSPLLTKYILVGGMPEVVLTYLKKLSLVDTRNSQTKILKEMRDDFGKTIDSNGKMDINPFLLVKTIKAFNSIPLQLQKENKKFKYSVIDKGSRNTEYKPAISWLEKSHLITLSHNLKEVKIPLKEHCIDDEFKVFFSDIGLTIASLPIEVTKDITNGDFKAFNGLIYECLAADILSKCGFLLFYSSDTKNHQEVDFIVEDKKGIALIDSIENNSKVASYKQIVKNSDNNVRLFKLKGKTLDKDSTFNCLPMYSLPFLLKKGDNKIKEKLVVKELFSI